MEDKKRILKWSHLFHSDEEDVFLYYTDEYVDTFRVGRSDGNKLKRKHPIIRSLSTFGFSI